MRTVSSVTELRRLAHDTARLARSHPRMSAARASMNLIASSGRPVTSNRIDDVFSNVEMILSDIMELER